MPEPTMEQMIEEMDGEILRIFTSWDIEKWYAIRGELGATGYSPSTAIRTLYIKWKAQD